MSDPSTEKGLAGRKVLLGVTGSIAAYKAAEIVRLLKKAGAEVQVLMTPDAARFITPLTLGTLSEREVLTGIFPDNEQGSWTKHVSLGLWADLFVVAPATAQTLAKMAHGFSDSMLTATALAARCPLLVCPAMDHDMYLHPATQVNLDRLRSYGYEVMAPGYGELASGLIGHGRMPEPEEIFHRITEKIRVQTEQTDQPAAPPESPRANTLAGKHVLVTAGPTREPIDPVRVITNHSTGTMGYTIAEAAARRGARVTLVSGPTALDTPDGVERINVTTAEEMYDAVHAHRDADLVVMAAAVADYTPIDPAPTKLKKKDDELTIHLRRTPDILASLGAQKQPGQVLVGFAMETDNGLANARRKLASKNLDWIVLNNVKENGAGFGTGTNRVTLIDRDGHTEDLPVLPKRQVAERLLDRILAEKATPPPRM